MDGWMDGWMHGVKRPNSNFSCVRCGEKRIKKNSLKERHAVHFLLCSVSFQSSYSRSRTEPMKVALFGTHPQQYNGYSKVVFHLARELSKKPNEIQLFIFGFQRLPGNNLVRPDLPDNVVVYDAFADEKPKRNGFGIPQVQGFVMLTRPDIVVVFNDMSVISSVVSELKQVQWDEQGKKKFQIMTYVDQVYLNQKKQYIDFLNQNVDAALAFSPSWARCLRTQGVTIPISHLPHGVDPTVYFPIPRHLVRKYYGFSDQDFVILNINRNQPRKRWDT
jgi:glycosyltransferase involved in cell wall biosynthesis